MNSTVTTRTRLKRLSNIAAVVADAAVIDVPADAPAVEKMVRAYREKFGLGPRVPSAEIGVAWHAIVVKGEAVAVFGERWREVGHLEVTDAYCEPTRIGRAALGLGCLNYRDQVKRGMFDVLTFTVLHKNETFWKAAMRAFDASPYALVFAFGKGLP